MSGWEIVGRIAVAASGVFWGARIIGDTQDVFCGDRGWALVGRVCVFAVCMIAAGNAALGWLGWLP